MSKSTIKPVDGTKPEEFLPFEAALERMLTAEGGQLLLEHLKGRHEYELTPGDPPVAIVNNDTQLRAPSPVEGAEAIKLRYVAHRNYARPVPVAVSERFRVLSRLRRCVSPSEAPLV